ncbi:MAG: chromate transporter [Candidatus Gastranaerophilales bacterium]|nr:chromate transporter [Candidatus Gastranaerophilales bacterium]
MIKNKVSLYEISKTFFIIGATGFGEGMAIISLMQDYCVNRKKWLETDEFAHGITLGQFLGSFAVNASIFIGYRLGGVKGAIVSLLSFLTPSIIFVIMLSALYMHFQKLPSLQAALKGIEPVVIALIVAAAFRIGKNHFKSLEPVIIAITVIILSLIFNLKIFIILILTLLYGFITVRFLDNKEVK